MRISKKIRPVYLTEKQPTLLHPPIKNIEDWIAQSSDVNTAARISENLDRIIQGAQIILRVNGIENPRIVFSDGQLVGQLKLARDAFIHAFAARKYFTERNYVSALDWALLASDEFGKAVAFPFVQSAKGGRKRIAETTKRVTEVTAVGQRFIEEKGYKPNMGRLSDRQWINDKLVEIGSIPFRTWADFRSWRSKRHLKPGQPW